jgi:hypothetical protein
MYEWVVHTPSLHPLNATFAYLGPAPLIQCKAQAGVSEAGHSPAHRQHGPVSNHRARGTRPIGRPGWGAAAA